jgi:threonine synthase
LKTTDALEGCFEAGVAVKPKLAAFDEYIRALDGNLDALELELAGGVL